MPFNLHLLNKKHRYSVSNKSSWVARILIGNSSDTLDLSLTSNATGQDCVDIIAQRVNLIEVVYFGLSYETKRKQTRWLDLEKPLRKQLDKHAAHSTLRFGVMYFVPDIYKLQQQVTRSLFYYSTKSLVLSGAFSIESEQAVALAAYSLQADYGELSEDNPVLDSPEGSRLFPESLCVDDSSIIELLRATRDKYAQQRGLSRPAAEFAYLLVVSSLHGYGSHWFPAKDPLMREVRVGLSWSGLTAEPANADANGQSNRPDELLNFTSHYRWADIKHMTYSKRSFGVETIRSQEVDFSMEDQETAKYVWRLCVAHHRVYRLNQSCLPSGINVQQLSGNHWGTAVVDAPSLASSLGADSSPNALQRELQLMLVHQRTAKAPSRPDVVSHSVPRRPRTVYLPTPPSSIHHASSTPSLASSGFAPLPCPNYTTSAWHQRVYQQHPARPIPISDPPPRHHEPPFSSSTPDLAAAVSTNQIISHYIRNGIAKAASSKPPPPYPGKTTSTPDLVQTDASLSSAPPHSSGPTPPHSSGPTPPHSSGATPPHILNPLLPARCQRLVLIKRTQSEPRSELRPAPARELRSRLDPPQLYPRVDALAVKQAARPLERRISSATAPVKATHTPPIAEEYSPEEFRTEETAAPPRRYSDAATSAAAPRWSESLKSEPDIKQLRRLVQQADEESLMKRLIAEARCVPVLNSGHPPPPAEQPPSSDDDEDDRASSVLISSPGPPSSNPRGPHHPEWFVVPLAEPETPTDAVGVPVVAETPPLYAQPESVYATPSTGLSPVEVYPPLLGNQQPLINSQVSLISNKTTDLSLITKETCKKPTEDDDLLIKLSHKIDDNFNILERVLTTNRDHASLSSVRKFNSSGLPLSPSPTVSDTSTTSSRSRYPPPAVGPLMMASLNGLSGVSTDSGVPPSVSDESDDSSAWDAKRRALETRFAGDGVFTEFEEIAKRRRDAAFGTAKRNEWRNRFPDVVLPYEETRVRLSATRANPDGYINANHVRAMVAARPFKYVACQAPVRITCEDHWRAVWECRCTVIAMLVRVNECGKERSYQYWPTADVPTMSFGPFRVTFRDVTESATYITSVLTLENAALKQIRTVWHVQYTDWPETGCPDSVAGFTSFLDQLNSLRCLAPDSGGPRLSAAPSTMVHCCSGVGRTGVLILAELMLACLEHDQPTDIQQTLAHIRQQRMLLVQNITQYLFVYKILIEFLNKSRLI